MKNMLLVEGKSDKAFFENLCMRLDVATKVQVSPPKEVGGQFNSKEGLLNNLGSILEQLSDGSLKRVAAIVDADRMDLSGLGWDGTLDRFIEVVLNYDFHPRFNRQNIKKSGLLFSNSDKNIHDFGLWIMPKKGVDGVLENWIKESIKEDDRELLDFVDASVCSIENPKFSKNHQIKAEIATWLAWQKYPGRGAEFAITNDLLDKNSPNYLELSSWLTNFFAS